MAWWQKKLLRYALNRTGFLDEKALDLDNLDITLGKSNVVELKDVGLNLARISKLAQLPPCLRIETAKVLSLRLTVPADIYQSGILAEVDGVYLSLRLDDGEELGPTEKATRAVRSPVRTRSPQHRKSHRRLESPPPYDPGGSSDPFGDVYVPSTEEMAKSFLLDESAQERRQLEASVNADRPDLATSITSEISSEDAGYGTGAAIGLPGFLAGFLQGIVDRFEVKISDIQASIHTSTGEGPNTIPVTLNCSIETAALAPVVSRPGNETDPGKSQEHSDQRQVSVHGLTIDLLSKATAFSDLSELPSRSSPAHSREPTAVAPMMEGSTSTQINLSPMYHSKASARSAAAPDMAGALGSTILPDHMAASIIAASTTTADSDRFADAGESENAPDLSSELDIQAGDDNISWGSRRSKSSAPSGDLWNSVAAVDDLPDSLLLDQRATRHRSSMDRSGPSMPHNNRDASPFKNTTRSPGSWPQPYGETQGYDFKKSPGSWPVIDSEMQCSHRPEKVEQEEQPIDNMQHALEASVAMDKDVVLQEQDLEASRVFSHEEARSMYMSAMTSSPPRHIPGGWGAESGQAARSTSPEDTRGRIIENVEYTAINSNASDDGLAYGDISPDLPTGRVSGNSTPRAHSPDIFHKRGSSRRRDSRTDSKQICFVDAISIWLPSSRHGNESGEAAHDGRDSWRRRRSGHRSATDMPGTFMAYSELASSTRSGRSTNDDSSRIMPEYDAENVGRPQHSLVVEVAIIRCQLDISSCRLLHRLFCTISTALAKASAGQAGQVSSQDQKSPDDPTDDLFSMSVDTFDLCLRDSLLCPLQDQDEGSPSLVRVACRGIGVETQDRNSSLHCNSFTTFLGDVKLVSFHSPHDTKPPMLMTNTTPDVLLKIAKNTSTVRRAITEMTLETLTLNLDIQLQAFDAVFTSFGGLSGIMEAGNSFLSDSNGLSSPSSPIKPAKGVRFQGDTPSPKAEPELKFNGRVGGVNFTFGGETCAVQLKASTVKAVYREQGAVASIDHVVLSGPQLAEHSTDSVPLVVDLVTLRVDYLFSPQEKDLDRLLSLLIPSKDKYDGDDEILIDTLLRQRRKGAVARTSLGDVKIRVTDWASLSTLSELSDQLKRLSAVTKYLPEDDRPGLLSLIRIKDCEARLPVNECFGRIHLRLTDLHFAHVGIPSLIALSAGTLTASQAGKIELVHTLIQEEVLPVLMVRMLGDDIEPTIKVKLFNLCAEYSVSTILAFTALDPGADVEDVVTELAQSVAGLILPHRPTFSSLQSSPAATTPENRTKTELDLLIHDSAVGLQPLNMDSKALLALNDVRFVTTLPPDETITATLELRKAAVFLADRVIMTSGDHLSTRGVPSNTTSKPRITLLLARQGFVSIGSIMTANIQVRVQDAAKESKSVTFDVKNELLLLETCADSTHTLFATLGGLAPPASPNKQPKYLTEPMTIEDMIASFSGDPEERPQAPPEMLFDADLIDDEDMPLDLSAVNADDDGLLAESEMTSSLYGPVSGIIDPAQQEDPDDGDDFPETAESLLEDDPFEMTDTPEDVRLSDAHLIRELNKQRKPNPSADHIALEPYEIEDLGFDALVMDEPALGTQHGMFAPVSKAMPQRQRSKKQILPFRLRVRDSHIIWNLYDGYDWHRTREGITEAVEQVENRAEERKARQRQSAHADEDDESVIGDFLFNSIYIGIPSTQDAQGLRRQINRNIDDLASETESVPVSCISRPTTYSVSGRPIRQRQQRRLKLERSKAHKIAFELKGVSADILVFDPDSTDTVSTVDVRIQDLEIFDNVPTSTWRKFLTHYESDPAAREMAKPMFHIQLHNVRTLENYAASEIVLRVSVLPLRLHVDQDALDFITRFFEFKDDSSSTANQPTEQPFIQRIEVDTVDMCLDYKPKKIDYVGLRSGHATEFMNFVILDAAHIRLKHAIVYGIRGFEPLHKTLNDVWMPDIRRNQLPTILAGLAPVRSLVNIGTGVRDVVAIPVREYRKDGRIVRSIQKGAFQFGKTTASELARLGAKVAMGTQTLLTGAEGLLSPGSASSPPSRPSSRRRVSSELAWHDLGPSEDDDHSRRAVSAYADQPLGVFSGLRSARRQLEHDLLTAKDALIAVQGEILESSGPGSAVAAVARHAPTVILRPVIGASRAVGTTLLGVGNQIDRQNMRRVQDKYKSR